MSSSIGVQIHKPIHPWQSTETKRDMELPQPSAMAISLCDDNLLLLLSACVTPLSVFIYLFSYSFLFVYFSDWRPKLSSIADLYGLSLCGDNIYPVSLGEFFLFCFYLFDCFISVLFVFCIHLSFKPGDL